MDDSEYHYGELPEEPSEIDLQLFDLIEKDDACPSSHEDCDAAFKVLLQRGARIEARMAYGITWPGFDAGREDGPLQGEYRFLTPLDVAAFLNQPKWLEIFANAQLPIRSSGAAYWAAFAGSRRFLLEMRWARQLDLSRSEFGVPLHVADPDITADFLHAGADVNAVSVAGSNALHNPDLPLDQMRMLMAAGVNVNLVNADGATPFQNIILHHRRMGGGIRDADARILAYIAYGLDLEAVVSRDFRGDDRCSVREWIAKKPASSSSRLFYTGSNQFPRSDLALNAESPQLFAARELLKMPKEPPPEPPRKRAQFPKLAKRDVVERESGVTDRIQVAELKGHWRAVPSEREWLPLVRPIDEAVFDLIDRDATVCMPYDVALGSLRHLLRLGASVDCCRPYCISELEHDPEEGPSYGQDHLVYLKPLELAVHLNAPKWVRIYAELGFSVSCPAIAYHAAAHRKFLREMYDCGALNSGCLDTAFVAMASHVNRENKELARTSRMWKNQGKQAMKNEGVDGLAQLLGWGADVNAIHDDFTALDVIVSGLSDPDLNALRLVLAAGGNPNRVCRPREATPFAYYLSSSHRNEGDVDEGICLFLGHGADVDVKISRFDLGPNNQVTAREYIAGGNFPRAQGVLRSLDARRAALSRRR